MKRVFIKENEDYRLVQTVVRESKLIKSDIKYEYDENKNRIKKTDSIDNSSMLYEYDKNKRLIKKIFSDGDIKTYGYKNNMCFTSFITHANKVSQNIIEYGDDNRVIRETYQPNNRRTEYNYNKQGRLLSAHTFHSLSGVEASSVIFIYNKDGRVCNYCDGETHEILVQFEYDDNGNLIKEIYKDIEVSHFYEEIKSNKNEEEKEVSNMETKA